MAAAGRRQTQTLHEMGRAARRATLVLGGLGVAMGTHLVKNGVEFEKEMSRVRAVLSATGGEMEQLNKLAMKMGADTKFSAGEAAKAMYELGSAGFSVQEMSGAMKGTLALAAASSIELADAAEISSNALRGFGLQSSQTTHVADVLAKTVNASSVEMNDLQFSMKYIGPIARSTGQSFEQMVAALGIMGDAGIKGEQAGTTLRGGLVRLVKPTKMVREGFDKIGLSAKDLQGPNGLRPLGEIIAMLSEKTKGMETAQRNQALAQIFGTEALSGMLALIDEGPAKLDRLTRANERAAGSSAKAAKTMQDNVAGAFEQLTGSIETVEIALYQQFQEPLKQVLLDATREVNTKGKEVEEFFDRVFEMPEFKAAGLGGKLRILLDELDKTGLPDEMGDLIVEGFTTAIEKGAPLVAEAAGKLALVAARGFFQGFEQADPVTKVLLALFVAHKTGMLAAIRAAGARAGAAYGTSAAAAAAATGGGVIAGGKRGSAVLAKGKTIAKGVGVGAVALSAVDAATAPNLNKGERAQQFLSFGGILGESGRESADKAERALAKLRDRLREVANAGKELPTGARLGEFLAGFDGFDKLGGEDMPRVNRALRAYEDRLRSVQALAKQGLRLDLHSEATNAQLRTISTAFDRLRNDSVDSIKDVRAVVRDNMRLIAANTKAGSADAKAALANNFRLAADAVRRAMKDGTISTKAGLAEIEKLMAKALQQYGFSAKQAKNIAGGQRPDAGPEEGTAGQAIARARGGLTGGLTTVGRKGAAGRDTVPALLNGQPAVVAEGEDVAVINRHQRAELDRRLADQGGLAGFFQRNDRPHYMASGGLLARGGFVQGASSRGLTAAALSFAGQMFDRGFNVTSAYRSNSTTFHGKGSALDFGDSVNDMGRLGGVLKPMRGRLAELFGPGGSWKHGKPIGQVPGHDDHWHVAVLERLAAAGDPAAIAELRRVKMRGGLGTVTQIGQGALDTARAAASARLQELAGAVGFEGQAGHGPAQARGAMGKGDLMALWRRAGGDPSKARLMAAIALAESSGNPSANGPPDGRGLWQIEWPIWRKALGHLGDPYDPLSNARMAREILDRQGLGAWVVYNTGAYRQYMAKGGLVGEPMAKGGTKRKRRGSQRTVGTNRTPKTRPKARGYKPGKAKFRLGDIAELKTFERLGAQLTDQEQAFRNAERVHGLTDEEPLTLDADGNEVRDEAAIARRVAEIDQLIALKADSARWLAQQQEAARVALQKLADGIRERVIQIQDIKAVAKANIARIRALHKKVAELDRDESRSRAAIGKAKGSKAKAAARRAHEANVRANRPARKAIGKELDGLRDDNERLVGSRSVNVDLESGGGGLLGTARDQMAAWTEERERLAPDAKQAVQNAFDVSLDIRELQKERVSWSGTAAPPVSVPGASAQAVEDNKAQLAELLRAQLDDERAKTRMLGQQFDVFKGFGDLVGARLVGSFLQGGVVPRTGLAYVHEGETFVPRPDGPFRMTARDMLGGGRQAAPQVTLIVEGDIGPMVKRMRAEIDGRAAKVVSQQTGRTSRLIASAPGGR